MTPLGEKLYLLVKSNTCLENIESKKELAISILADLNKYSLHAQQFTQEGFPSIFASTQNTKKPKILLQAHLDVVPGPNESFTLKEQGDKLIGRGVFDMKFAAACYLQLLEDLKNELIKYDFGIMFTFDEEVGGENGVAALLDRGYSADVCILPDGGDNWQIEESCNSVWIVKVLADGCSAHGSRPWEGDNAITKLIDCLEDIRSCFDNSKKDNTLTVSQFEGGCALNQVPEEAWATLDMRFKNEDNYISQRAKIEKLILDAGLELETIAHVGATKLDKSNKLVGAFIDLAKEKAPVEVGFTHSLGSSDAHYFEARGIATVLMRPRGGGAHSDHEWINTEDLELYYELLKEYIVRNARIT